MANNCKRREVIFNNLLTLYTRILRWSGMDVLNGIDFTKKIRLCVLFVNITFFLIFNIYSIVTFRNDLMSLVFSVVVVGFWLSAMVSLYVIVVKAQAIQEHFFDAVNYFCVKDDPVSPEVEQVKDKYANWIYVLSKLYIVGFMSSGACISILPLILNALTGSKQFIFGIIIPFVEPHSSPGFEIIYAFQLIQVAYAVCGFPTFQFIYNTMILHSCCLMEVMVVKMQSKWERGSSLNHTRLREIIQLHQVQIASLERTQDIYGIFNINQLFCTVVQATLTAFILIFQRWLQGYILFFLAISVFFVSCLYGEFIQIKAQRLEVAVFTIMDWVDFSPAEQKMVIIFLMAVQKKQFLTCGKIFVIGLKVFMSVMKNIYSMIMMIRSMKI